MNRIKLLDRTQGSTINSINYPTISTTLHKIVLLYFFLNLVYVGAVINTFINFTSTLLTE